MKYQPAQFKTTEVVKFLRTEFNYASFVFSCDFETEMVHSTEVQKWFKSYFPSNQSQFQFRKLEASVTQYLLTLENENC